MNPSVVSSGAPLAARLSRTLVSIDPKALPEAVTAKVKVCLMDLIGCAFESQALPWSRQAAAIAAPVAPGTPDAATIIGSPVTASAGDAAFVNAVMGHGLVREDMHAGSFSHMGIVVIPTLLALAQARPVSGRAFITAAACGYEVGGRIGRAVMDPALARIFRPTGITGPLAAAAAGARLMAFDEPATTSALGLAANMVAGYNQWAHTGGSEMFFHAGTAARNAVTVVRLAGLGAFGSPSALDGEGGLFAALRKSPDPDTIRLFEDSAEILSVYHKPVPACNFAQTACQAALGVSRDAGGVPDRIARIDIRVPRAAAMYPGCDHTGPYATVLQAKMSIQYNVAAALMKGSVSEDNFTLLADPTLHGLIGRMTLQIDDAMTQAFPARQGAQVTVTLADGTEHRLRLDNVVNATADDVRTRFRIATEQAMGAFRTAAIEEFIDSLETADDAGRLGALLRPDR